VRVDTARGRVDIARARLPLAVSWIYGGSWIVKRGA